MCAHAERMHQNRSQRHHDHEIEDVDELDAGKSKQQIIFVLRGKRVGHIFMRLIEQGV